MTDPIFAIPRTVYGSYVDLYRLIELSGFPTVYIDEIDAESDNAYILTIYNHEVPPGGYPGARARIALWDLEYHLEAGNRLPPLAKVEVWAGDRWYSERIGAKYVPMGSHLDLRLDADSTSPERYDLAYLGYMIPRRQRIAHELREQGVKLSPSGAWGEERHRVLSNSSAYLIVHQWDNVPTICPLRMVVAAAYGLPVISEACADAGVFGKDTLFEETYSALPKAGRDCIPLRTNDGVFGDWFRTMGANLHRLLCVDLTFRKSVEAAL